MATRRSYHGSNPKKLQEKAEYNEAASKVEAHVNKQIKEGKRGRFLYSTISQETGIDREIIKEALFNINCGSNGFTIPEDILVDKE